MRRIKSSPLSVRKRIENFLIPPLCVVCDATLTGDRWFCDGCIGALAANHAARDACPRCSQDRRKRECACEFAWDFPFEKAFSAYNYDDILSPIVKHIKYKGKSQLAYHIGGIVAPLVPDVFFEGADIVIPVPLHKARMRWRGYNQAERFARGLLDRAGTSAPKLHTDLLTRVKNTGTQTRLDKDGRLENLSGAFAANPQKIAEFKGKTVILVDDVMTTGATTEACTDELLRAGCGTVRVLALGRD